MSTETGPTPPSDRIVSLDVLRGVAILGILLINVQAFSMPSIARRNPSQYGDFTGANFAVWLTSHLFVELKFITIFSILFGAGIVLFTQKKSLETDSSLRIHFRRTFWLLVIGVIHAYLLWDGDILVIYALCAVVVVFAREWPPRRLVAVGLWMLAIPFLIRLNYLLGLESGATLEFWRASEAAIQAEIETYRGSWSDQLVDRVDTAFTQHTTAFFFDHFWRYGGIMLLGMALFKWGVLSNERSIGEYYRLIWAGFLSGMTLTGAGVAFLFYYEWSHVAGYAWPLFNYWGSIPLALAYVSLVVVYCRRWSDSLLTHGLAAVGRTALSNYLFQTLVATTIFYGYGLGLFGQVTRVEQLGVVLAIWVVQIVLSLLWLRRFRYGPVEWVWRKLTYRSL